MTYERVNDLGGLQKERLITVRKHPRLPIWIYNYTQRAAHEFTATTWPDALMDCRGLILDAHGEIVARPFRKFFNYAQVLGQIPTNEEFTVWEKVDGSLGIVCTYQGERIVATRGRFESDQALWATAYLNNHAPEFHPDVSYLFEIVYPENRIVVDYGARKEMILLAVLDKRGCFLDHLFDNSPFPKARRYDGITEFDCINTSEQFNGQEGFVIRWQSGFQAKVKREEYVQLHRLITQCSTRTIWELLRGGKVIDELLAHVPADFADWVNTQSGDLIRAHTEIMDQASNVFAAIPGEIKTARKNYAEIAKQFAYPGLLFGLLDGKDISDQVWRLVEPKWATPFRMMDDD